MLVGEALKVGVRDAIVVDALDRRTCRDVFAAGNFVETYHRLHRRPTYISLGTIAHKQGRVAGENAVGGDRAYAGALGTQSLEVFHLAVAGTGQPDRQAGAEGFNPRPSRAAPMITRRIIQPPDLSICV